MDKHYSALTPERQLVVLCSRGTLREDHVEQIKEIVSKKCDWKEIVFQSIWHRTLNMMYFHLNNLGLTKAVDEESLKLMKTQSKVYAIRNAEYYKELKAIFEKLNDSGIRVAILKGNYLAQVVYPSTETRTFNDLDFLINVAEGDRIISILEDMGYTQGEYDEKLGEVIPSTKKQKLLHRVASYELQECMKKTDNPFTPVIQVDLNFDILWRGNCPYHIDTGELLGRADEVVFDGTTAYILDREDFIVQLACHLYKEAALLHWVTDLRDLKLYKFADILIYIEKFADEINWDKLIDFVLRVKCEKILYYTFYYVNLLYGGVVPEKVMKALEPADLDFLDEYGVENSKPLKWNYDFITRLFDSNRIIETNNDENTTDFRKVKYEKLAQGQ